MGLNAKQLREVIVRPALKDLHLYSKAAEDLVMGTAAQESHLEYVKQLGRGPALSIFQIEPATYYDYWENYLMNRPAIGERIIEECQVSDLGLVNGIPDVQRLIYDLRFAAMMCRIHYRRIRARLPKEGDIEGYAKYWKKYYNTVYGAGTEEEFIKNYRKVDD